MKPFNLKEALAGKPVITRDGRPVKIAGYNPDAINSGEKLVGWVDGNIFSWFDDGASFYDKESSYDLFMASEKRTYWVNVYRCHDGKLTTSKFYDTEEEAKKKRENDGYICTYPITIEE